jgi:hypothetical protein
MPFNAKQQSKLFLATVEKPLKVKNLNQQLNKKFLKADPSHEIGKLKFTNIKKILGKI